MGCHITKLLLENDEKTQEIRIIDIERPQEYMIREHSLPAVHYISGDIRDIESMDGAFRGVDYVIHCAAVISLGCHPQTELMDGVNIEGKTDSIS